MSGININNLVRVTLPASAAGRSNSAQPVFPPSQSSASNPEQAAGRPGNDGITPIIDSGQNRATLTAQVDALNQQFSSNSRSLRFTVGSELGRTIIQVIDEQTDEVIRQIPPEQLVSLAEHLSQFSNIDSLGLQEKT